MDTVVLVGRLLVSLAVVLGVLWLVARRMNRRGGRHRQSSIEVLGRQQLGRHSAVAVVRVGEQTLVLGVTESAVSLLTTADFEDVPAIAAEERPSRVAPRREADLRLAPRAGHDDAGPSGVKPSAVPAGAGSAASGSAASGSAPPGSAPSGSALSGSALSPGTWRQTVDALRDLTARSG